MVTMHLVIGTTLAATNLGAGIWGGWAWYRDRPTVGFWYLLRVAQTSVVVQVMVGGILVVGDHVAPDDLHYLYGVLPIMVSLLAEGARGGVAEHELEGLDFHALPRSRQAAIAAVIARRETGIMAVSALVVFGLAVRAALTSTL